MGTFGFLGSASVGSDAQSIGPQRPTIKRARAELSRRCVIGRMILDPSVNKAAFSLARAIDTAGYHKRHP
jgi:hypothetical protein